MSLVQSQPSLPEASPAGRNRSGPITYDEMQGLADGTGFTYELFDGILHVNPAPFLPHQSFVMGLVAVLTGAVPPDLRVYAAPVDWKVSDVNAYQPDVLVVRRSDATGPRLAGTPVLAVEVLSESTRRQDLGLKREHYGAAGLPEYWIVDPDGPSLLVLRNDGAGGFDEVGRAVGEGAYESDVPFPVRIVPARLPE